MAVGDQLHVGDAGRHHARHELVRVDGEGCGVHRLDKGCRRVLRGTPCLSGTSIVCRHTGHDWLLTSMQHCQKDCRCRTSCTHSDAEWLGKLLTKSTHQLCEEVG